jgi:hypothetical protein
MPPLRLAGIHDLNAIKPVPSERGIKANLTASKFSG